MSTAVEHVTVLLQEAVDALQVRQNGVYADLTFGRGGHSRLILERLGPDGRLIAMDRDLAAVEAGQHWQDKRFELVHGEFAGFGAVMDRSGIAKLDGVLMDLGVSSPQLDEAARGFSFRFDAPLDMRMNQSCGMTAAQWLAGAEEKELMEVIRDYGEERHAKAIARAVVAHRARAPLTTTLQLARLVASVVPGREIGQNPATRTFQAIRIYLNREIEELRTALPQVVSRLNPGGRLVVISFHSLEDRVVKRFMRECSSPPPLPARLPVRASEIPPAAMRLVGRAVRPGEQEVAENPRARSAIMRVLEAI